MASENYQRQLADPQWQRKRLEVLNRDNFKCTICDDDTIELHIHHKKYDRGKKHTNMRIQILLLFVRIVIK